jgi:hypothetical protein
MLHFYKNDQLAGQYIDDYLSVTIEDEAATSDDHVTAPSYADIIPPKPVRPTENATSPDNRSDSTAQTGTSNGGTATQKEPTAGRSTSAAGKDVKTVIQDTDAAAATGTDSDTVQPDNVITGGDSGEQTADNSENLLNQAQDAYTKNDYRKAYALLDSYLQNAATRIDEALFLKGQILEAKSDIQDIHGAIEAYDEIVTAWPGSDFWERARQRSIYLKRFYINIR